MALPPGEAEPTCIITGAPSDPAAETLQPRTFQYEMLEESLRRNIIVAMDTGSGKTLIAVLRIQAELERSTPEKLVWFLAPNVALATQQAKVIATQIPSVQTRLLLGSDNVEHWSEQWVWDGILDNIRIVISTYQILLDALIQGFVQMARLSLMVFDEAHHCIANNPASRILRDFYHPHLDLGHEQRPAILGLTASPVVNSSVGRLEELEQNLQAISRTPKRSREEMLRYVHRPSLVRLVYAAQESGVGTPHIANELEKLRLSLDIEQDPYVLNIRSDPDALDVGQLNKALIGRKTYCQEQIKMLHTRAKIVEKELGLWAVCFYVDTCIQKVRLRCDEDCTGLKTLASTEIVYLEQCLNTFLLVVPEEPLSSFKNQFHSAKVLCLVDFLIHQATTGFCGLVFVRTRAEVAVLSELLSRHPDLNQFYTISTFVGASSSAGRKVNIGELVDARNQIGTLDDLRAGRRNLVITTSALEEGIDVPACNVVVCFDNQMNLKSLIQRRGRARQSKSTFAIMFAESDDPSTISTWEQLETRMRHLYEDDMRQLAELETTEATDEGERVFIVEKTGAKLLLTDAVSHLYHFCATLPSRQFGNSNPVFTFQDTSGELGKEMVTAKVSLPISVDVSVREACGQSAWKTEKAAKRDAAFVAYLQLYNAGLLSDNLLPTQGYDEAIEEVKTEVEKVASLVQVRDQINPWHEVARQWRETGNSVDLCCFEVTLHRNDETTVSMQMLLPCTLPAIPALTLYWDSYTIFTVVVRQSSPILGSPKYTEAAKQSTTLLLSTVFRSRIHTAKTDFVALFAPSADEDPGEWTKQHSGTILGESLEKPNLSAVSLSKLGIVRDLTRNAVPYILRGFTEVASTTDGVFLKSRELKEDDNTSLVLEVSRFPKRTDFLHPVPLLEKKAGKGTNRELLGPENCEIDKLPISYAYFAAAIPAILHRVGVRLVATRLCSTLLKTIPFNDLDPVITAITASAAREPTNYQRQEYLGDSILKFLTSLTLVSEHLRWHEGYLSKGKDHIVSNASLAKAALAVGLDEFILAKAFTGAKWKPLHVSDLLNAPANELRELSTKTLADVVEALVGAAFLDGGLDKAIAILKGFLPRVPWSGVEESNRTLLASAQRASVVHPHHLAQPEELIGYDFGCKSLPLEALTHSSYIGSNVTTSYDRLEFLGDVCLDIIVSTTSFKHEPAIATHGLHLIRTAVVNADFLAFLCLTLSISVPRTDVVTGTTRDQISLSSSMVPVHIWSFLRHASPAIRKAQVECTRRYEMLSDQILALLHHGDHIPWALLTRLDAPKFYSDIIESVVGAIYIDSHGSLVACENFLEKLGVMSYLRRLLEGSVALYHPKEELGQVADTETVKYEVSREADADGERRLACKVWLGQREVVMVGDGVSQIEVETRAADEALMILKAERRVNEKL
ncbi:MAG: hypothetical protein Q9218_000333 [Villophora microphyllina]